MKHNLIPEPGEHALFVGQNGSGKTRLARWVLERMKPSPIVIYDTKEEADFITLPNSRLVEDWDEVLEARDDDTIDYVIFRPHVDIANDAKKMDALLLEHFKYLRGVPAYIDEVYSFHSGPRAGPGLNAMLTRGRSRNQSTLISTQRPRFLSNFCISETKHKYIFHVTMKDDRKRIADFVPGYDKLPKTRQYGFWYYNDRDGHLEEMAPIQLGQPIDMASPDSVSNDTEGDTTELDPSPRSSKVWL